MILLKVKEGTESCAQTSFYQTNKLIAKNTKMLFTLKCPVIVRQSIIYSAINRVSPSIHYLSPLFSQRTARNQNQDLSGCDRNHRTTVPIESKYILGKTAAEQQQKKFPGWFVLVLSLVYILR